ncbi:hypothetical protein [Halochromatium sp.]
MPRLSHAMLMGALIVASSLLEGCVIGAAVIGAHVYSTRQTKQALSQSVTSYDEAASLVQIGDSKAAVLALLEPTQTHLKPRLRREAHSYQQGGDLVEIYYFRSGWHADGLNTDDEFTPYIFRNCRLTHIGWRTLTGARTKSRKR